MRRLRLLLAVAFFSSCTCCAFRAMSNGDCHAVAGSLARVSDYVAFCTGESVAFLGKDEAMSEILGIVGSEAIVVGGLTVVSPVAGGAAAVVGMGEKAIDAISEDREPHDD